jgi:hypothetical protein
MLLLAAALIAAPAVASPGAPRAIGPTSPRCPHTTSYYAWQRDKRVAPRKLTELPRATAYMSVLRIVNGCEAPLTATEYRRGTSR